MRENNNLTLVAMAACIVLQTPCDSSAVDVSGSITNATSWTTHNSPYVITHDLTVTENVILEIDPGVEVHIGSGVLFDIYGTIRASGTALDPITFTAHTNATYGGAIRIIGTDHLLGATGTFENCSFSFLNGDPGMLQTTYARLTVRDCGFSNIPATAIRPVDSRAIITGCDIHDTHEGVNFIRCAGLLESNRIHRLLGNWDAIDLDAYWTGGGDDSLTVSYNILYDGYDDAIDVNFTPARITGNIISNFVDKGISLGLGGNAPQNRTYGETAVIDNNLILLCNIGVAIKDESRPLIQNNTLIACATGVASYDKVDGPGYGSVSNTVIWDCATSIEILDGGDVDFGYCAIQGDSVWPGPGNINLDPEFVDPLLHDYRLRPESPCIDTGADIPALASGRDLDGEWRLAGGAMDMGAYEHVSSELQCGLIATNRMGQPPLTVAFTAHVTGTNLTGLVYRWDFGADGSEEYVGSSYNAVTNTFNNIGYHSVSLVVSNSIGESASITRPDYIRVLSLSHIFVSTNGAHIYPFTDWYGAATNLEEAAAVAYDGSTIWVSNGLYHLTSEIEISTDVRMQSMHGADVTILDGGDAVRCLKLSGSGSVVDGFTLAHGRAASGGGLFIEAEATARKCIIRECHATAQGGGAFLDRAGVLESSSVSNNTSASNGGGVYLHYGGTLRDARVTGNRSINSSSDGGGVVCVGSGIVEGCIVTDNTAADDGGGVQCGNNRGVPGGTVKNTEVWGNTCSDKGGGIMLWPGSLAENCLVVSNQANLGGGMMFRGGGTVSHVTVVANRANSYGGGTYSYSSGGVDLHNSIIVFNTAPSSNNCFRSASDVYATTCSTPLLPGTSNIDVNPLLVNVPGDLRLSSASPCVDAGSVSGTIRDIEGTPRPLDGDNDTLALPDMGTYETLHEAADSDGDGMPDGWERQNGMNMTSRDGDGDADGDLADNVSEYTADTDPRNASSVLTVLDIQASTSAKTIVSWPSRTSRLYRVLAAPHPDETWTNLLETPGDGMVMEFQDSTPDQRRFYRIGVSLP